MKSYGVRSAVLLAASLVIPGSLAFPGAAAAQIAVSPHVGTLGLGADVSLAISDAVSIRGGANFQPYTPKPDLSDITFEVNLPSPSFTAMVDLHLGGGGFRISGGVVYFSSDLELDGELNEPVDIGNDVYTPSAVGTLTGRLVTDELAPYVGIGWGNAWNGGSGFFMDIGVAFHGTPDVELSADGPVSSDPTFQANLDQEVDEIRDDVESFKVYPVVSLGFRLGVG